MISLIDIAWLAGLLEGEGCFLHRRNGDLIVSVMMTDADAIEKVQRILGFGSMKKPRSLPSGKTCFGWSVSNQHQAAGLMMTLLPLMCRRRAGKIRECLIKWKAKPLPKSMWTHCKNGHPLAGSNLRIVRDSKYYKRRCRTCEVIRQRRHRERIAA